MTTNYEPSRPCMAISEHHLTYEQVQAAMNAMMKQAQATSETPVCLAIVDASGNMEAFAKMDHCLLSPESHPPAS